MDCTAGPVRSPADDIHSHDSSYLVSVHISWYRQGCRAAREGLNGHSGFKVHSREGKCYLEGGLTAELGSGSVRMT